ncbi:MAG: hypothetical protein JNL10_13350 [Verrucomicrobiales bacterium]|nr:hypothetical protein [Verrucomicrobiales bacterium]
MPSRLRSDALAVVVGFIAVVAGCSRSDPAPPVPTPGAGSAVGTPQSDDLAFRDSIPRQGGPEGYAGSESCKPCHADQFNSWHRTFHRSMTQYATPETVKADFNGVVLTNDQTQFHLSRDGEELRVRMEKSPKPGASDDPPAMLDTRISLVTGSHHMQVFWVPGGSGNTQIGFPFTWLIPEGRWVPRDTTFLRPPGLSRSPEVWNVMCSRCHATAIEPRVDAARHVMDSRAAELGISCEACHGPGQRHVAAREATGRTGPKPDAATLHAEILQPETMDPVRASETCGFCHSMKWIDRSEAWRDKGFRFRPGDSLEDTTPLIQPSKAAQIPGLREYLERNPTLLADFFWSDGMGRVSGREYNSLVQSPCFKGGKFSCLSCHSLHDSDPNDLLARNRGDNRACTQCHERFTDPGALQQHTHHRTTSSGSECYNCHMPHTTYGVLTAIRSHQISSPRVSDELATGRPNACNLCHLDKTLEWTATHLSEWFHQPVPGFSPSQRTVADGVRLALAGDAGQRVLLAWHFGWEPARITSGSGWIPPMLGILMDDPYAAIRCVASRSLRSTSRLEPPGYDYVTDPEARPDAWEQVWGEWYQGLRRETPTPTFPEAVLVKPVPASEMESLLGPLLQTRDNRPIRLRE